MTPWRVVDGGLELALRLTPKGGRDQIDGIKEDASGKPVLTVRISAPPVNGAANKALLKFLSKASGVPKSRIRFISGETSRIKRLMLEGDGAEIADRLLKLT
ncbi:MAG: DUF167 domain-containing protein [Rhodobacteraceae bacterium]|nr:DUF167 domain-containing protein [Paracoccaceae bacterium]